jgi:hypothetical protein
MHRAWSREHRAHSGQEEIDLVEKGSSLLLTLAGLFGLKAWSREQMTEIGATEIRDQFFLLLIQQFDELFFGHPGLFNDGY